MVVAAPGADGAQGRQAVGAMFRLEDFTGQCKCILWSDEYARFKDVVANDAVLLFEGAVEWREGGQQPAT